MKDEELSPTILAIIEQAARIPDDGGDAEGLRSEVAGLVPEDLRDPTNLERLRVLSEKISTAERLQAIAEENFQELADEVRSGVTVMLDGRIIYANAKLAEILGVHGPAALKGAHYSEFVHFNDQGEFETMLVEEPEREVAEVRLLTASGQIVPAECTRRQLSYYHGARLTVVRVSGEGHENGTRQPASG